ncbi:T22D3 protein, partial [Aleadryas rufinucha]|nr:T22D3 protein [Aleadryas rufinucha]
MSRKKSGFAITSVRGGSGTAPGDASGAATGSSSSSSGSPSGSRFRLVRLLSPGEVLRRGRWLCRDFYERDASPRGGGGGGGRLPVSLDAPRAVAAPHQPRSLGAFAQLVQQVRGRGLLGRGPKTTPPTPLNPLCLQALPPKPPSPRPGGGAELSARLGLAGEESEDEGAGSGVTAIDNKIERAMDLVKSHLLLAVREEVEALREQIRELSERRAALERENRLLRALATPQQLARLRSPQPPGPPPGPS